MQEILRSIVMTFWSDGGQGDARRNAWSAMVTDAKRARERNEAASYVNAVAAIHERSAIATAAAVAATRG